MPNVRRPEPCKFGASREGQSARAHKTTHLDGLPCGRSQHVENMQQDTIKNGQGHDLKRYAHLLLLFGYGRVLAARDVLQHANHKEVVEVVWLVPVYDLDLCSAIGLVHSSTRSVCLVHLSAPGQPTAGAYSQAQSGGGGPPQGKGTEQNRKEQTTGKRRGKR